MLFLIELSLSYVIVVQKSSSGDGISLDVGKRNMKKKLFVVTNSTIPKRHKIHLIKYCGDYYYCV